MGNIITVFDKEFESYIDENEIERAIEKIAAEINSCYSSSKEVRLVAILNGSFMFAADLVRKLTISCKISFVKVALYSGLESSGSVCEVVGLDSSPEGEDIILLDEIIDTGCTIKHLTETLINQGATSVRAAALIYKPKSSCIKPDFFGINMLDDNFIIGYGLDYNGLARELKDIYILKNNEI